MAKFAKDYNFFDGDITGGGVLSREDVVFEAEKNFVEENEPTSFQGLIDFIVNNSDIDGLEINYLIAQLYTSLKEVAFMQQGMTNEDFNKISEQEKVKLIYWILVKHREHYFGDEYIKGVLKKAGKLNEDILASQAAMDLGKNLEYFYPTKNMPVDQYTIDAMRVALDEYLSQFGDNNDEDEDLPN